MSSRRPVRLLSKRLKDLNPELLRNCTPPEDSEYEIKIPYGKKELFLRNFETLQPVRKVQFKPHVVKQGDTLSGIAKRYGVSLDPILQINQLKKTSRLSTGMNLLIPIPLSQETKTETVTAKKGGRRQEPEIKARTDHLCHQEGGYPLEHCE